MIHEIYADEAWTHGGLPPNRYWCFFGGIMGLAPDLDRLDTELRAIKAVGQARWAGRRNLRAHGAGGSQLGDLPLQPGGAAHGPHLLPLPPELLALLGYALGLPVPLLEALSTPRGLSWPPG